MGAVMMALAVGILGLDYVLNTEVCFIILVAVAATAGLIEFYALARAKGFSPFAKLGIGLGLVLLAAHWLQLRGSINPPADVLRTVLCVAVLLAFFVQWAAQKERNATRDMSVTLFGVLYLFFLPAFFVDIRVTVGSRAAVLVIVIAKFVDIGAYYGGRAFGRHKLAPVVSPKKTIEGLAIGLLAGAAAAIGLNALPGMMVMPWRWLVPFSLIVGASAQLGDLAESLVKRDAAAKDSGAVIPGFGGVLDVIDCLLIAGPVAYFLFRFVPTS